MLCFHTVSLTLLTLLDLCGPAGLLTTALTCLTLLTLFLQPVKWESPRDNMSPVPGIKEPPGKQEVQD